LGSRQQHVPKPVSDLGWRPQLENHVGPKQVKKPRKPEFIPFAIGLSGAIHI